MPIYSNWDLATGNDFSYYNGYFIKLQAQVKMAREIDNGYPVPQPVAQGLVLLHIYARDLDDALTHAYKVVPDLLKKKYEDLTPDTRVYGVELWFLDGKKLTLHAPLYESKTWVAPVKE